MASPNTFRVERAGELLVFLQSVLPDQKRTKLKQYLKHQCVTVNGRTATRHDHPLVPGDRVSVDTAKRAGPRMDSSTGVRVLYEDDAFLVIHKPPGMLSVPVKGVPAETAFNVVNEYMSSAPGVRRRRAHVVHRLDKHTSGLLIFAKTLRARAWFLANWKRVEKTYLAIVEGVPARKSGVMKSYLKEEEDMTVHSVKDEDKGEEAVTRYRVVKTNRAFSLVECILETGRKNQIRVQLAELGHPIAGDRKYGSHKNPCRRLALHAWRLRTPHPETGKIVRVESEYPEAMARILPLEE